MIGAGQPATKAMDARLNSASFPRTSETRNQSINGLGQVAVPTIEKGGRLTLEVLENPELLHPDAFWRPELFAPDMPLPVGGCRLSRTAPPQGCQKPAKSFGRGASPMRDKCSGCEGSNGGHLDKPEHGPTIDRLHEQAKADRVSPRAPVAAHRPLGSRRHTGIRLHC